jgi:serine/threonine-protein kinase
MARSMLAGRYRLGDVLGRGGMSTVYRAEDVTLERTVAVKVMSAALAEQDPVSVARFEREARAVASLTHRGVATVYDAGVEGETRYIVMELAPGRSLQAILQDEAPLATARTVDIAAQVADVLSFAHRAGIVHRDVKPGNIMVAPGGSVKVLDFGIARAASGATLTQVHSVVGTVAFMSPEQALGEPTDARSDIYSLGCVIYAMLTAKPPFMAEVTAAVLHQHTSVPPRPLHELSAGVPAALEALVMQMLAKDRAERPQTAAEVRDRLLATLDPTAVTRVAPVPPPAIEAEPTLIATAPVAPAVQPTPSPADPTAVTPRQRPGGSGRGLAIAALALLAVVIAVIAVLALAKSGGSSSSAGTAPPQTPSSSTTQPSSSSSTSTTTTPSTSTTTPSSTSTTTPTSTSTTTPSTSTTTPATTSTTTPATTSTTAPPGTPPGQGGVPPGQAKK